MSADGLIDQMIDRLIQLGRDQPGLFCPKLEMARDEPIKPWNLQRKKKKSKNI
jgi:hypothetical protein